MAITTSNVSIYMYTDACNITWKQYYSEVLQTTTIVLKWDIWAAYYLSNTPCFETQQWRESDSSISFINRWCLVSTAKRCKTAFGIDQG